MPRVPGWAGLLLAAAVLLTAPAARAQRAGWDVLYRRTCSERVHPVPLAGGDRVLACSQAFAGPRGGFTGRALAGALAALPDGTVLAQTPSSPGLARHAGADAGAATLAHDAAGVVERIGLSPSGRLVATLESSRGEAAVVLRETRTLRRVRAHALPRFVSWSGAAVSVDDAGRVTFTVPDGRQPGFRGLATLGTDGSPVSWPLPAGRLVAAAVAAESPVAAVAWPDGRVTVHRRRGAAVAATTRADTAEQVELALDARGTRLAIVDRAGLRVLALARGAPRPLFDQPLGGAPLAFARSGQRLFLGGPRLVAVGPGGGRRIESPTYAPTLPDGWERGVVHGDTLTFRSRRGSEWAAEPGYVAAFAESDGGALVIATATDADEFAAQRSLASWARAVVSRYEPFSPLEPASAQAPHPFRAYRDAAGRRTVDLVVPTDGCDPSSRHVRFVEIGGALLHVILRAPLSLEPEDVVELRRAFLDAPLGAPPAERAAGRRGGRRAI